MDADEIYQREYFLELKAAYQGWLMGWTPPYTARLYALDFGFVCNVYNALNRRWPGMARRYLYDPVPGCFASDAV